MYEQKEHLGMGTMMFAAGVGCSPNKFQSDRGRFANLLSQKPPTIVHVTDNPLTDFFGAREDSTAGLANTCSPRV
jgi:hypothetical protein